MDLRLVLTQVSKVRDLIRYMIFVLNCLIAVGPGYFVFQQVLKYLNSLNIWENTN
jgi:hypothetical protein